MSAGGGGPAAVAGRGDGPWTVLELLRWTTDHFTGRGLASPRLDAECLLAHALGTTRLRLYLEHDKPVQAAERARFRELVRRRGQERVPVAQLTGRREFWSLPLRVGPEVLCPRPETETLVDVALRLRPDRAAPCRVLDVGTGSGAVALALARERPAARVVATDVSDAALALASENAQALGLSERVELRRGSLYHPVAGERFDLVLSNPPYLGLAEEAGLEPELAQEPREALFAGRDGLDVLRPLVAGAREALAVGGAFAVELAPAQAGIVAGWLREAGFSDVAVHEDLAGRPRVASARLA